MGLRVEVRGVGAETGGAQTQREESLTKSLKEYAAAELREVGHEQELHPFDSAGQQTRRDDNDDKEDEQDGHEQLRGTLDAVADTTDNHEMGEEDKGDSP